MIYITKSKLDEIKNRISELENYTYATQNIAIEAANEKEMELLTNLILEAEVIAKEIICKKDN